MTRARLVTVAVTLVVIVATGAGPAVATMPADDRALPVDSPRQTASQPVIAVTVEVDRMPDQTGQFELTYTYEIPDNVRRVDVQLPTAYADERVGVATDGFEQTREGDTPRYAAFSAGGSTRSLTITYEVGSRSTLSDSAPGYDTDAWTYVPNVDRPTGWRYEGEEPQIDYTVAEPSSGFVTDSAAFVGEYTEYTTVAHGQRFHLVVPADTDVPGSRETAFATLADASDILRVGDRDEDVYVVTLRFDRGTERNGVIGEAGDNVAWVAASRSPTGAPNTWIHEYVHTRQGYEPGPELRWFDEGSAEYLEHAIPLTRGNADGEEVLDRINDGFVTGRLASPDSWGSPEVEYTRGARAVALLNRLVVEATEGDATVVDVFRVLNDRAAPGRTLTGGDLRAAVREVTDESAQSWYETYVTGGEPITIESPWAFVLRSDGDPDGDGLANTDEYDAETNPYDDDTDGDDLDDAREVEAGADPTAADTDGDGIADGAEVSRGLDPTSPNPDAATETPSETPTTATATDTDEAATETPSETTTEGNGPLPLWVPIVGIAGCLLAHRLRR